MEASTQALEKGPLPPKRRSKSRSGCQRCKQRHIKCDERIPFCGPCVKRGFSCPGYRQPMKWRYLDASEQSRRRPEELDRNLLSEGDTDTFTQPAGSVGSRNPRESAANDNLTTFEASINASEEQRCNRQDSTTESWNRDRIIGDSCGSSSDLFPLSFSNGLATEDIWNMGNNVMDSLLDNNALNTEFLYPLFKPIGGNDVVLSTHYFSNVCPINSCFDSQLNPFRSVMADLMKSSQLVFHLVMMTSASHLCHQKNEMFSAAQQHRRSAISCLKEERNVTGNRRFEAVLGSALLGMTSAWQDSRTLGISHIHTARALFQEPIAGPEKSTDSLSTSFLVGIMAYWEAMVPIIIIQSPSALDYLTPFCEQENHDVLVHPNPWTGASTTLFIYAAQASTLCRQNRVTKVLSTSMPSAEIRDSIFREQFTKAAELEAKVFQYTPPPPDRIRDPDDRFTPVSHIQRLAQIYRLSVLLQLYLTFPHLLQISSASGTIQRSPKETMLWLAVNILSLISSVPESSGIKYLLTVPLIISGSALQKVEPHDQGIGIPLETSTSRIEKEIHSLHCSDFMIFHWRSVVRHKLKVLHDCVGLDPVRRALQLLEAVWLRSDLSFSNRANDSAPGFVHWLDVMVEERLESIFG